MTLTQQSLTFRGSLEFESGSRHTKHRRVVFARFSLKFIVYRHGFKEKHAKTTRRFLVCQDPKSCAYRFEPLLTHLSERWDYLNEFEWSVRRVMVENIAVIVKYLSFKENYY